MHLHTVPPICRPRRPWTTALYQVVDRHFETFAAVYDDRFAPVYGPWRPVVRTTADAFLDCGRYEGGSCRLRCDACGTERLLAFSCRRRGLCPSCAARTAALGAHVVEVVLLPAPHRQVVLTIPKRLRIYFRFDRRLLADLARAITDVVRVLTDHTVVDHIIAHLRRTRPGLFPPTRGSPTLPPTDTTVCRADADGFIYAQDFPLDE